MGGIFWIVKAVLHLAKLIIKPLIKLGVFDEAIGNALNDLLEKYSLVD